MDMTLREVCGMLGVKRRAVQGYEKGRLHSAIANRRFKETLLWDHDTFVEVMRCRTQKARVSFRCPRCSVDLEESAEFDYLQPSYRCHKCGKVYDYFNTKVVFDE